MSERFIVPENLSAVDVPGIVREEDGRALVEANLAFGVHSENIEWRERYLAARFPEAAPEGVGANMGPTGLPRMSRPLVSTPNREAAPENGPIRFCAVEGCGNEADPGVTVCEVCWDRQYKAPPERQEPTYSCMFNFCPTPEKCRAKCQSPNGLRPEFPSAPTVAAALNERLEPSGFVPEPHIGHTEHGDLVYAMSGQYVSPDRLAKLERFVTALARTFKERGIVGETADLDPVYGNVDGTALEDAAREYLR